jgi:hypothetical protein
MAFGKHMNGQHLDKVKEDWMMCSKCPKFLPDEKAMKYHVAKTHLNVKEKSRGLIDDSFRFA